MWMPNTYEGNVSQNMGRPLTDSACVASSCNTSQCSARRPSSNRTTRVGNRFLALDPRIMVNTDDLKRVNYSRLRFDERTVVIDCSVALRSSSMALRASRIVTLSFVSSQRSISSQRQLRSPTPTSRRFCSYHSCAQATIQKLRRSTIGNGDCAKSIVILQKLIFQQP